MNYRVIVIRPDDGVVLVLPSSQGWAVPEFVPGVTDARIVEHINDEMRQQLGFDTWILKCAARGDDDGRPWRIFVALARDAGLCLPPVQSG